MGYRENEEWVYDEISRRLKEMENLFRERTKELFHDRLKDFGVEKTLTEDLVDRKIVRPRTPF